MDMHWKRRDSQGTWSEKYPQGMPERCGSQDPTDDTEELEFIAYYWVRPEVVKLRATIKSKAPLVRPASLACPGVINLRLCGAPFSATPSFVFALFSGNLVNPST
jgi:hypothetical protein